MVELPTSKTSAAGRVVLGNSITLSPGTVTIDMDEETLQVHCLTRESAEDLLKLEAQRRVTGLEAD
jgi:multicomponent Na+:H+ antiporter subunit E